MRDEDTSSRDAQRGRGTHIIAPQFVAILPSNPFVEAGLQPRRSGGQHNVRQRSLGCDRVRAAAARWGLATALTATASRREWRPARRWRRRCGMAAATALYHPWHHGPFGFGFLPVLSVLRDFLLVPDRAAVLLGPAVADTADGTDRETCRRCSTSGIAGRTSRARALRPRRSIMIASRCPRSWSWTTSRRSRRSRATTWSTPGSAVIVAGDGAKALDLARSRQPDLIVLDLALPAIDGLDVARELRRESNVPIIMLTARVEETRPARGAGASAPTTTSPSRSARASWSRACKRGAAAQPTLGRTRATSFTAARPDLRRAASAADARRRRHRSDRRPSSSCWRRWRGSPGASSRARSCSTPSTASTWKRSSAPSTRTSRTSGARSSPTPGTRSTC